MTPNLTHTFTRTRQRQQETDLPAGTAYSEEIEQYINLLFGFDRQRFPGARYPPLCNRLHAPTPRVVSSIRNIRRMFAYGVEESKRVSRKKVWGKSRNSTSFLVHTIQVRTLEWKARTNFTTQLLVWVWECSVITGLWAPTGGDSLKLNGGEYIRQDRANMPKVGWERVGWLAAHGTSCYFPLIGWHW